MRRVEEPEECLCQCFSSHLMSRVYSLQIIEQMRLWSCYRVWAFFVNPFAISYSHKYIRMDTVYQMSSCSVSSLICCELCFFFYLSPAFCCRSLFPSFPTSPLPPPPSRLMLNLLLRLPPNTIHPPPLPPCLQEFVPHYRSLLHPNQPSHPAWSHSFSTVLSHYLCRHQRGRALRDIRHSPSVRGLGVLTELTGD